MQNKVAGESVSMKNLLPVLSCVLVVLIFVALRLLREDPILSMNISSAFRLKSVHSSTGLPSDLQHPDRLDPVAGYILSEQHLKEFITLRPSEQTNHGFVLIGLGDCASCISLNVSAWKQQMTVYHIPVVAFSYGSDDDIKLFQKSFPGLRIYRDRNRSLVKQLNCYWAGRVYYFDAHFGLRWIMHDETSHAVPDSIPELKGILNSGTRQGARNE